MNFKQINIKPQVISFFQREITIGFKKMNNLLKESSGIVNFFSKEDDFLQLKEELTTFSSEYCEENKTEYGDFQTNRKLSLAITNYLATKQIKPQILIEPTCGKGSFILSAIQTFNSLNQVFGIEINENYLWELKFELLEYFLQNSNVNRPEIYLFNQNIFHFDFQQIKEKIENRELLIIGNPPWVTTSTLSTLNSTNLPNKKNFKNSKGLDAITGKGNFDIGESILLKMLDSFATQNGSLAFLIKNSVIKNLVYEQNKNKYPIANLEKYNIDAKKEFSAAVNASFFLCNLNSESEFTAKEFDFYSLKESVIMGWINGKFASDIDAYSNYHEFDGICPFEWRQGIKHDCSKVMEMERINSRFKNTFNEEFELEEDLVYGILKSSDLKGEKVNNPRKYTIVTQQKVGQETAYILEKLPKTKSYLESHKDLFLQRKSSIYNGKPMYSIFGIGDYSFKPYKVAISGLYKQTKFTLIEPNETVLMLDDTCYFIGFDNVDDAKITQFLLNKPETQKFMRSFIFMDAKRAITKDLLMRINLNIIIHNTTYYELQNIVDIEKWEKYLYFIESKMTSKQILLFA